MNIEQFVQQSIGRWKSQRSGHNLAFQHFEEVRSTIDITALDPSDAAVIELCQTHGIDPTQAACPFHMSWEGESDWDDNSTIEGSCILVPVPDGDDRGRLLRSQGYAETMPAIGLYHFTPDEHFVLATPYDRASAEERIWFATGDLRFRVSLIKTSLGTGVVTASFASEIRDKSC
jgi:phycoerythrin-associated linker protein